MRKSIPALVAAAALTLGALAACGGETIEPCNRSVSELCTKIMSCGGLAGVFADQATCESQLYLLPAPCADGSSYRECTCLCMGHHGADCTGFSACEADCRTLYCQ